MRRFTVRFEILLTPEQNQRWEVLAQQANISKAELVRQTMANCQVKSPIPQPNWEIYQKLGELTDELKVMAPGSYNSNQISSNTINKLIAHIEQLRWQILGIEEKDL